MGQGFRRCATTCAEHAMTFGWLTVHPKDISQKLILGYFKPYSNRFALCLPRGRQKPTKVRVLRRRCCFKLSPSGTDQKNLRHWLRCSLKAHTGSSVLRSACPPPSPPPHSPRPPP